MRGFEVRARDVSAAVMLLMLAVFMISMAVAYGGNSCNASSAPVADKGAVTAKNVPASDDAARRVPDGVAAKNVLASDGAAAKNVPASFAIGEKLSAGSSPALRGSVREWAGASKSGPALRGSVREWAGANGKSDPALRGFLREWADANSTGSAMAGVCRKVEAAYATDIGAAFAGVRKKVEAARANLPQMMLTLSSKPVFEPSTGGQPGTLRLAEPGERRVPPLFDRKFGYTSNGAQAGEAQQERLSTERDQAEGDGSTFEGWEGGHSIKSGIDTSTWSEGKNWAAKKAEVREPMKKICALFDDMFNSAIAPGASTEKVSDTDFVVRLNGTCLDPVRYYEFVGATVAAQMGAKNAKLPEWAQSADVSLGLENLKASIPGLRTGISVNCAGAQTYKLGADGAVLRSSGEPVSFDVPWPADGSTLITHSMKLKPQ